MSVNDAHRAFVRFLNRTRRVLKLESREFAKLLDFTPTQLDRAIQNPNKLYASHLQPLLNSLDIGYEHILENTVDYSFIAERAKNNFTALPERYSVGASGKRRTIINILDYVSKTSNTTYAKALLLGDFQLNPKHFENPDLPINNNFICDLLKRVTHYGFTEFDVIRMGRESYFSNRYSDFGKMMSKHRSQEELFEHLFDELIAQYDSNFVYTVKKLSADGCTLQVRQNHKVAEAMQKKKIGSKLLSISKIGVIQTVPLYLGYPMANVKMSRCSFENDSYCQYDIRFLPRLSSQTDFGGFPTITQ